MCYQLRVYVLTHFFLPWRNSPSGPRLPRCRGFITTLGRTPPDEWSAETQRPLPDNTQHSQEKDIHVPGWIRTHNPSKRAAAVPRLRPRGHWDRHVLIYTSMKSCSTVFQVGRPCRITNNRYQHWWFCRCQMSASRAQLQKQIPYRTIEYLVFVAVADVLCYDVMRGCNDYTMRHADGPKRTNVVFLVVMYGMCGTPIPFFLYV